jgi:hypothetical protein
MVTIPAAEAMACFVIDFIDDKIGLQPDKIFDVRVTVIQPSDVGIMAPNVTLTISDTDGMYPQNDSICKKGPLGTEHELFGIKLKPTM